MLAVVPYPRDYPLGQDTSMGTTGVPLSRNKSPVSVVVAIGHDRSPDPEAFTLGVRGILASFGTVEAEVSGPSVSAEWGSEPAVWWAVTFPSAREYRLARASILAVAHEHRQDAVAFTVGTVDVARTTAVAS